MRHRPTALPALVALALVALTASASAATHDLAPAPTPAPPAPIPARLARQRRAALAPAERARHLEERQFLCGLFGTCSDDDTSASGAASSTAASATDSAALSASDPAAVGSSTGETSATSATDPALAQSSSSTLTSSSTESTESTTTRPSRASTTSSSTTTTPSSTSQIVVTITSVVTNEDGSQSTMLQESASAVAASSGGGGGGPSGKTWGIIGGVVGGVALLVGIVLVIWRLTQRRFANLDNDHDEIRWPELQPDGQTVSTGLSTLNPQGTRRTGGAGIAMEKDGDFDDDDDDELDRKGGAAGAGEWPVEASPRLGAGGAGAPGGAYALGNNQSEVGFFEGQGQGASPYELAYVHGQAQQRLPSPAAGGRTSYYDPYLGAAPIPSPHLAPSSSDPSLPLSSVYPPSYATAPAHSADPYAGAAAAAGARNSLYGGMAGEYQVPMSQEELHGQQQQPYGHYSPHAHGATSPSMRY